MGIVPGSRGRGSGNDRIARRIAAILSPSHSEGGGGSGKAIRLHRTPDRVLSSLWSLRVEGQKAEAIRS